MPLNRRRDGGESNADRVIRTHAHIIETVLRQVRSRRATAAVNGVDDDELRQAGRIALWRASETWEPSRGSFETWAHWRVEHAMLDELRKVWRRGKPRGGAAHFTYDFHELDRSLTHAAENSRKDLMNTPVPPAMAALKGAPSDGLEGDAFVGILGARLLAAVAALPPLERLVFQLADIQSRGQREVARLLDVSTGTVVSLRREARRLIREQLADAAPSPDTPPD